MPLLDFRPTVTVVHPAGWLTWIGFPGRKPFGRDEGNALSLPQGARLERWATELSSEGSAQFQDVALVNSEGGTILLKGSTFDNLVQSGVLEVDKHLWEGQRAVPCQFPLAPCDPQEHATEAEYIACPLCHPPFPTEPEAPLWEYTFACHTTLVSDGDKECPVHGEQCWVIRVRQIVPPTE